MRSSAAKSGQKRVNVPSPAALDVVDLTVQLLTAKCGAAFGKGFRLRAVGKRLYVQISGLRIPLHLGYEAEPIAVQARAMELRDFLEKRGGQFDSEEWRAACSVTRVRGGKPKEPRLDLEAVSTKWRRLKLAEGISEVTMRNHYETYLRRLDPRHPLSEESMLRVIEGIDPRSPSRRRAMAFLRRLCALCGVEWNSVLFEPLRGAASKIQHRPQAYFSDQDIEAMLGPSGPFPSRWRRMFALMAIYGLRPWEAWIAEPCKVRPGCVWIGIGKTNSKGTTKPRQVPPFHVEWLEAFDMERLWGTPPPRLRSLSKAGSIATQTLRRAASAGFTMSTSYGFRHAYARRLHSPRYRVTDTHAALFMGHTVVVHNQIYRAWLGGEDPIDLYLGGTG